METLSSRTDYFECELDPNEFKRDPNAKQSNGWRFRDIPYYFCHLLLTLLYLVVTPMTIHQAYTKIRKETKRAKRNLRRKYRHYKKFGLFSGPQKKESTYKLSANFITDKMLSSSEDEASTSASSSSGEYESPQKMRGTKGVFTA